ncbi:hypothetical protein KSS87_007699 [Heliosperma pusillum]|nr:hypothetical protein KSS87_007699 [Heliosperma pusillum]
MDLYFPNNSNRKYFLPQYSDRPFICLDKPVNFTSNHLVSCDYCCPSNTMAENTNTVEVDESANKRKPVFDAAPEPSMAKKPKPSAVETHESENNGTSFVIEAGAAEDKGSRHTMEDLSLLLPNAFPDAHSSNLRCAHFAIYDGHGGRMAAEYAQKHLNFNVISAGFPRESLDIKAAKKAILEGFRRTDEGLLQESTTVYSEINLLGGWLDGATAVCIWILGQTVFVANIGDAKAVVARSIITEGSESITLKAIVLTREHKVIYPVERSRIQKAGGLVGSNGRLQGRLEVSRAFGDRQFKKRLNIESANFLERKVVLWYEIKAATRKHHRFIEVGVVAVPDIQSFDITQREHFIILGSDGLWGVLGPKDAVDFVHKLLKEGLPVAVVCRRLVREAVFERGCKDNCTALVIIFRRE